MRNKKVTYCDVFIVVVLVLVTHLCLTLQLLGL